MIIPPNFVAVGFGMTVIIAAIFFTVILSLDSTVRRLQERVTGLELEAGIIELDPNPPPETLREWIAWRWQILRQQTSPAPFEIPSEPPPPTLPEMPAVSPEHIPTEPSHIPLQVQNALLEKQPAETEVVYRVNRGPERKPTPYKRPAEHDTPVRQVDTVTKSFGGYTFQFAVSDDRADGGE